MTNSLYHPTQLWISDPQTLVTKIVAYLQKQLCANNGCGQCVTCKQIEQQEHPWVIWVTPERAYNLEQIDEVIAASSFQLDAGEKRFFIFPQAERLTDQCSNRLLKTIEEPFFGYFFFFLTSRAQALPQTVQSRCVLQKFTAITNLESYQEFLEPFMTLQFTNPVGFIKQVESLDIKEQETKDIIDGLFDHWSQVIKTKILEKADNLEPLQNLITVLQDAINNPPMTGSTKIFWKNFYITAHHAINATKNTD